MAKHVIKTNRTEQKLTVMYAKTHIGKPATQTSANVTRHTAQPVAHSQQMAHPSVIKHAAAQTSVILRAPSRREIVLLHATRDFICPVPFANHARAAAQRPVQVRHRSTAAIYRLAPLVQIPPAALHIHLIAHIKYARTSHPALAVL
jgi:hypothetical protein